MLLQIPQLQDSVGIPHIHRALPFPQSIETLRVDGSGRHSFPAVLGSSKEPLGLAVFESRFFWTDGAELVSATRTSPQERAVLLRAPVSAFTVLHALQQPPREYPASYSYQWEEYCLMVLWQEFMALGQRGHEPVGKLLSSMGLSGAEFSYLM